MARQTTDIAGTSHISTPLKIVFLGAALTIVEAIYYIANAELLAEVEIGGDLSTTAIIVLNLLGTAFVLGLIWYAYSVRTNPTKRSYLVILGLSLLSLFIGILLTNFVTIIGAIAGYWSRR